MDRDIMGMMLNGNDVENSPQANGFQVLAAELGCGLNVPDYIVNYKAILLPDIDISRLRSHDC